MSEKKSDRWKKSVNLKKKSDLLSDIEDHWIEKYCHIASVLIGLSTEVHLVTYMHAK
jgi:hypothetical protein